jgi:hypothetical protein
MALKTLTLALVLTGLAAGVYANRRRRGPWARAGRRGLGSATATTPSAGTASPMAPERMPMGGTAAAARTGDSGWAAGSEGGDLFSSSSQQSERPAGTGLPDFTRGA